MRWCLRSPSSPSCNGLGRARWHRRLRVSECARARSEGTTARSQPTACHLRFAHGVGEQPCCVWTRLGVGPLCFNASHYGEVLGAPPAAFRWRSRVWDGRWDLAIFFGARTAGEGWGPRQTRAACHFLGQARVQILHAWAPRHCEVARASATRAIGAVVVRVLTAGQLASAGLVGHLLLRRVRGGRVGRKLVPFHFAPASKPVAPIRPPVAWAAWVAPRFKPSLANPMAGGRLRYPR